jgi:hypothetical protein
MKRELTICALFLFFSWFLGEPGIAQNTHPDSSSQMQSKSGTKEDPQENSEDGMYHPMPAGNEGTPSMPDTNMHMQQPKSFLEEVQQHSGTGTDVQPSSTAAPMFMMMSSDWTLMLHGVAFFNDVQQSGPRGGDKFFSTNWIMGMAQRAFGGGTLSLRAMLSFEPATIPGRFYPELFQQGETAFGKPIVDGQHPHNFLMEIAGIYDFKLGERALLSFYGAPVGAPAVGPPAYPHRMSASEDPIAPLSHHLQDSTHIAFDVVTTGFTYRVFRVEASGFYGREPGEDRWAMNSGKIDSWSTRLTWNPGPNWSGQYSFAHLTSPEALHPGENIDRMTASVAYNRPLASGNWASLLAWGRNKNQPGGLIWNSYLAESTLRFARLNYIWGRLENVDRTSELLLESTSQPAISQEGIIGRVKAFTVGYDRDVKLIPRIATAAGAQATFYDSPDSLKALYGSHPVGVLLFLRLRLAAKEQ